MTHANQVSTKQVRFHLSRALSPGPHPTSQGLSQLSLPGPQVGHEKTTVRVPALVRSSQGHGVRSGGGRELRIRISSEGSLWALQ